MRIWNGYEDLRAMQELAIEHRRLRGARAPWHIGDIAWGFRQHAGREDKWTVKIWEEGGRVVAWSWRKGKDLDYDIHPDHRSLLDEILDDPAVQHVVALEDEAESLARRGFARPAEVMDLNVRELPAPPEPLKLPDGFRLRTIEPGDLAERVAVHRDVWAPSRVTEESYANVIQTWPYRPSLDCVVEAPDGRFAAYALLWPDDANAVGELEPVGTREEFRGRGLGAAVCTHALRRWHEEGGRQAIVYCQSKAACALYRSVGFELLTRFRGFTR